MKCPHCLTVFHDKWSTFPIQTDEDGSWILLHAMCPQCKRLIIRLLNGAGYADPRSGALINLLTVDKVLLVHPKGAARFPMSERGSRNFVAALRPASAKLRRAKRQ